MTSPLVLPGSDIFHCVNGVFYRAVDPMFLDGALGGSRAAGRYSTAEQPALYLSSSREGVEAAMTAHRNERAPELKVVSVEVVSSRILDLRDVAACREAEIDLQDAIAPWQEVVAQGKKARSWRVRDQVLLAGGLGLIDPSRKAPGLWHLVLFAWNLDSDSARVRLVG